MSICHSVLIFFSQFLNCFFFRFQCRMLYVVTSHTQLARLVSLHKYLNLDIWISESVFLYFQKSACPWPQDVNCNVHKTFRRHPGCLLNILCAFNLSPLSSGVEGMGEGRWEEEVQKNQEFYYIDNDRYEIPFNMFLWILWCN